MRFGDRLVWLNGINMPWNNCGWDFGTHPDWGSGYDAGVFSNAFAKYAAAGINAVRVFIHFDGRASPEFDAVGGPVTGLDANFLPNVADMVQTAGDHGLWVVPCLWSFEMVEPNAGNGAYAGQCRPLIDDPAKTQSYIDNALAPLLQQLAGATNILAWEICNEPEWMVENHGVDKAAVQRFHGMLAAAVHEHGRMRVTTGCASLKYHSDVTDPLCDGNWWKDGILQAAASNALAHFDLYVVHFWEWMAQWGYEPYTRDPAFWGLTDRPVIVGEAPGKDVNAYGLVLTPSQMVETAFSNGYAGHFAWSDRAGDGHGAWSNIQPAAAAFASNHPAVAGGVLLPDSDYDSLSDEWENAYFGSLTATDGGSGQDWDGDRFPDVSEQVAGTDPTNAASRLVLSAVDALSPSNVVLNWSSVSTRTYSVHSASNALTGFEMTALSNLPATPPANTVTVNVGEASSCLFRIGVGR